MSAERTDLIPCHAFFVKHDDYGTEEFGRLCEILSKHNCAGVNPNMVGEFALFLKEEDRDAAYKEVLEVYPKTQMVEGFVFVEGRYLVKEAEG